MSSHARPSRPAMTALYVLALIWGYNWVVMKRALHYMGPFQFGAMRTLLAALILFAVVIALKKPLRLPHMAQVGLIGLLQTCGFTALIIWALVAGGAGKVAVLSYTMPFWVMLLAWPLLGERIRGTQWIAVMASVTGLLCILEPWHLHGGLLSDVLALMSGLCWAAAVILAKQLHHRSPDMDLLSFTAWQMLLGSLPLVALAFAVPASAAQWTPLSRRRDALQCRRLQCPRMAAVALRLAAPACRHREHDLAADAGRCRDHRVVGTRRGTEPDGDRGHAADRRRTHRDRVARHAAPRGH